MAAFHSILESEDWQSVVDAVDRGACILLLGPDAVTVEGTGQPLDSGLAVEIGGPEAVRDGLWSAAQSVLASGDRNKLYAAARPYLLGTRLDRATLAPLARLPFALVVNTVPGARVEEIWRESGDGEEDRELRVGYYNRKRSVEGPWAPGTPDSPLVYHLFGSVEAPDSLVLSESDLLDFLVAVISGDPPLPNVLSAALKDESMSLLFLGFRLGQWPLRVLMRALAFNTLRDIRSYALEHQSPAPATQQFYQDGHNVLFYRLDVKAFAERLEADVRKLRLPQAAPLPPPAADSRAPLVFISYASEDRDAALRLADALRRANVRAWLDTAELRGGDDWKRRITAELSHGSSIDYMVILQTEALLAKTDAFVNVEIKLGLERQQFVRESAGRKFIVPVAFGDGAHLLEDLNAL